MHLEPVECSVLENVRGYTLLVVQIRAAGLGIVSYSNLALSIYFHPDLAIFISPAIALKRDNVSSDSTWTASIFGICAYLDATIRPTLWRFRCMGECVPKSTNRVHNRYTGRMNS